MLKKEYKFEPSNAAADEEPDADGITPSMLDFSWERDVTAQVYPYLDAGGVSYSYIRPQKYSGRTIQRI